MQTTRTSGPYVRAGRTGVKKHARTSGPYVRAVRPGRTCKTTYRCVNVGGLGEHPVYHCKFLSSPFFFFFDSFISCTGRTSGPIFTKIGM